MMRRVFPWSVLGCVVLALVLVARMGVFAGVHGGVEHDSGWYIGVARNLAQRGIYAAYTSTASTSAAGVSMGIHGRETLQDEEGFDYFYPGVTVGPGYVVPQAVCFKVLGYGEWARRAWPMLGMFGLLVVVLHLLWRAGGPVAAGLMVVWLWVTPRLTFTYAYEAFSEHIALMFALLGVWVGLKGAEKENTGRWWLFWPGVLLGMAYMTKTLAGLLVVGAMVLALVEVRRRKVGVREAGVQVGLFVVGVALPAVVFGVYRYVAIVGKFGTEGYAANERSFARVFAAAGSGLSGLNWESGFLWKKLELWREVGVSYPTVFWFVLLGGGVWVLKRDGDRRAKALAAALLVLGMVHCEWYLLMSPTGWLRHVWFGVVLGMMLVCLAVARVIMSQAGWRRGVAVALMLGMVAVMFREGRRLDAGVTFTEAEVEEWNAERYTVRGIQGVPSTPVILLRKQREVVAFLMEDVKAEERVYYADVFMVAGLPPLVDRVFRPSVQRREGERAWLVMDSNAVGEKPWRATDERARAALEGYAREYGVFGNGEYVVARMGEGKE